MTAYEIRHSDHNRVQSLDSMCLLYDCTFVLSTTLTVSLDTPALIHSRDLCDPGPGSVWLHKLWGWGLLLSHASIYNLADVRIILLIHPLHVRQSAHM